jgi:hypothetical protein
MKSTPIILLTATSVALGLAPEALAQYSPPPPLQPFAGFVNEALRQKSPYAANWDLSGAVRFRYELRDNNIALPPNNDFRAGVDNDNSYLSDKILMRVGYTDKWWGAFVEGRSSSVSGDDRGAAPNIPTGSSPESDGPVDLHQAYLTLGNHKEFPLSVKVGRQELAYGDERMVGALAWHNVGRVFDAAKMRWQNAWFGMDAFVSRVVVWDDNNFNVSSEYEHLSGVYINTKKIPKNWTEFYFLASNISPDASRLKAPAVTPVPFNNIARDTYTIGARFRSATNEWGNFDYTVEGAKQFGNFKRPGTVVRPGERDEHDAFAVSANFGYTFNEVYGKPRLALEYSFASGDSDPTDSTHGTFDNLYPTNHKFYGYMDLVSWQNIHDVRAIYSIKPHPRVSVAVEGHAFWLADTNDRFYNVAGLPRASAGAAGATGSGTGYGINPTYDSFVGTEVDVIMGVMLSRFMNFEAGYAHFFAGPYISQSLSKVGSKDADWLYGQLLIRF